MLAPAIRDEHPLPAGHPCAGCEVRNIAVCGILDCGDLARFKGLGWTLKLSAGQTLFHEGDPATRVFTLTKGTLKLYKLLADGRRHAESADKSSLRQAYVRLLIDEVTVEDDQVHIRGSRETLERAIIATSASSRVKVPSFAREWRARKDSNL